MEFLSNSLRICCAIFYVHMTSSELKKKLDFEQKKETCGVASLDLLIVSLTGT